ncbi:MAG: hypothetical protein WAU07_04880 [Microgenomates group bacterium]
MNKKTSSMLLKIIPLLVFIVIGSVLRLTNLNGVPSILNRDEAALGYNAYLLSKTGMDEWSKPWPVVLESFGDFKLPGYPLFLVGLFSFLPLEDWVVRLPSALAGILLIPLGFYFARKLDMSVQLSLIVSALIATAPVFLFYSRIAFEANVALALFVPAIALLFSKKTTFKSDTLSAFLLLASIFTYNAPLLMLPFIVFAIVQHRGWNNLSAWMPASALLLAVFMITMTILMPITAQKQGITIFEDETAWSEWNTYRENIPVILQTTLGSRPAYWTIRIAKNFISGFSLQFLVEKGGSHPWHTLPGWGHIFLAQYILCMIGIVSALIMSMREGIIFLYSKNLVSSKNIMRIPFQVIPQKIWQKHRSSYIIALYLLAVSLIPASITVDAPHATRSLFFFFLTSIFAVIGLHILLSWTQTLFSKKHSKAITFLLVLLFFSSIVVSSIQYNTYYFKVYSNTMPQSLQSGYNHLIRFISTEHPNDQVAVVDQEGYHYILTAWYSKMDSAVFFDTVVKQNPNQIGFRYGERVGNYHFIAKSSDRVENETILLEWSDGKWTIR